MKFGAVARMIQTAYESMQFSPQMSASALGLLQVSFTSCASRRKQSPICLPYDGNKHAQRP
jgi:hypothetical protein